MAVQQPEMTYIITGDIEAMWLRDSSMQVLPYLRHLGDDTVSRAVRGLIRKQADLILIDPYANAFNRNGDFACYKKDHTKMGPYIWERKYEVDSLAFPIFLLEAYYEKSRDDTILTDRILQALETVIEVWKKEQNHAAESDYKFERDSESITETLENEGKGSPVGYTGMTWSGFRPSDDACQYGYLIPSNMMAVVALSYAAELADAGWNDMALASRCHALAAQIDAGIQKFGIVDHPKYGKIYAYETDGFGNYNLMDDANSPSLLSLPYLGYCEADDPIYQNTRRFILSKDNPYFYEGTAAKGIGSPHTPQNYIWHISLSMQALTSTNEEEIQYCMDTIAATHAGTCYMHEGFDVNDPSKFTREWFAWANTLFAQTVETLVNR